MKDVTKCLSIIGLTFVLLNLAGCSNNGSSVSSNVRQSNSQIIEDPVQPQTQSYVLQTNDVIDIKFAYEPQLNERVTIRPDGMISLQIIDEVKAAGLTPAELDRILTERYAKVLNDPEIAVIAREFAFQKVYVGGEVANPGIFALNGNMTVLEAIVSAGGFRETAERKSVIVISKSPQNTRLVRTINVEAVLSGTASAEELPLKPFDVVHVPKTAIAKANKFVDEHIRKMIPVNLTGGFSYTLYRDTRR